MEPPASLHPHHATPTHPTTLTHTDEHEHEEDDHEEEELPDQTYPSSPPPSPTLHVTPGAGTNPSWTALRGGVRLAERADGRLNRFHAGVVPPPARPACRPTVFAAVHPHVQRTLTRHVHKLVVAMFGMQEAAEAVGAYLGLPPVQQRLGSFFGDPAVEVLLFACSTRAHTAHAQRRNLEEQTGRRHAGEDGRRRARPSAAGPAGGRPGAVAAAAAPLKTGASADGVGEDADCGPVRLLGIAGQTAGIEQGWCGDLVLLQKYAAVVDPFRPSECIGVTKTCGAAALTHCREMLSGVLHPLMAAATGDNWGVCSQHERRRVKQSVSSFCSVLQERAATYSDTQRALTLPSAAVRNGIATAGLGAGRSAATAASPGDTIAEAPGNAEEQSAQRSVLLVYEELTVAWLADMERAMEESTRMGAVVRDQDGPAAELRCWGQRAAMLGAIEKQLESHECQLVTAVLTRSQSELQQPFTSMRTQVIEASRSAKEVLRQLCTLGRFVDALYSEPLTRVAQMMQTFMEALHLMTTSSQHFCKDEHREGMFKKVNYQVIAICHAHLSELGDAWELPVKVVAACMGECRTLRDSYTNHAERALDEIERHPSCTAKVPINRPTLFEPLETFVRRLQLIEGILSTIETYSNFKRTLLTFPAVTHFNNDLGIFFDAVADLRHAAPDLLDLSASQFEKHANVFLDAKSQMEVRFGEILRRQLKIEDGAEGATMLLGALRTALPESFASLVTAKFISVITSYEALLHRVQKRYEKQKTDPPLPRNFPRAAGHVSWARHLRETVDRPMRSMRAEAGTQRMLSSDHGNSSKVVRAHQQLVKVLLTYEHLWFDGWCRTVAAAEDGLRATVIVCHPDDGELYVNFDPDLHLLVREAKCFERMGKRLPEPARQVMLRGTQLLRLRNNVGLLLDMRRRVLTTLPSQTEVKALLAPRCDAVESSLAKGMTTVTWSSLYADSWATTTLDQIAELKAGIEQTTQQMNVIARKLRAVSSTVLVRFPDDGEYTTGGGRSGARSATQLGSGDAGDVLDREHHSYGRLDGKSHDANSVLQRRKVSKMSTDAVQQVPNLKAAAVKSTIITVDGFVAMQDDLCVHVSCWLQDQNEAIESSVDNLVAVAVGIDQRLPTGHVRQLKQFYRNCMYRAVLGATTASLQKLKSRFAATSYKFLFVERPFFDVDVELTLPTVQLTPDLDAIQAAVNRVSRSVLECSAKLRDWRGCAAPDGAEPAAGASSAWPQELADSMSPFHARLAKDRVVMLSVICLAGTVNNLRGATHEYLQQLRSFNYLWQDDIDAAYRAFVTTTARGRYGDPRGDVESGTRRLPLDDVQARLQHYSEVEARIRRLSPVHNIGPLSIETAAWKHSLVSFVAIWKATFATDVLQEAIDLTHSVSAHITEVESRLAIEPKNVDDVRSIMNTLKLVRDTEADVGADLSRIEAIYGVMTLNGIVVPDGFPTRAQLELLRGRNKSVQGRCAHVNERMHAIQDGFRKDVARRSRRFQIKLIDFRNLWESEGPHAVRLTPHEAMREMLMLEERFHELCNEEAIILSDERLFGFQPVSVFQELIDTRRELAIFKQLNPLRCRVSEMVDMMKDLSWGETKNRLPDLERSMSKEYELLQNVSQQVMEMPEAQDLLKLMNDAKACLSVARQMGSAFIKWRHWIQAQEVLSLEAIPAQYGALDIQQDDDGSSNVAAVFRLGHLLSPHITEQEAAGYIASLCDVAEREHWLEHALEQVSAEWTEKSFIFRNYKNRGPLLFDQQHMHWLLEQFDDTGIQLGTMLNSPHLAAMRQEVISWTQKLNVVEEIVSKYMQMQVLWSHLAIIFCTDLADDDDLVPQDGHTAQCGDSKSFATGDMIAKFLSVDRQYEIIMKRAYAATGGVINSCLCIDGLADSLDNVISQLQVCRCAMAGFIRLKRSQFPRFYFLSDSAVLEVLSACKRDPKSLDEHIASLFDGVATAHFDEAEDSIYLDSVTSTAVKQAEGDTLSLLKSVSCSGALAVEQWLSHLEKAIEESVANEIMATRATNPTIVALVEGCPVTQVALVVLRINWTERCESAIEDGSHHSIMQVGKDTRASMDTLINYFTTDHSTPLARVVCQRAHSLVQQLLQSFENCVRLAEVFREQPRQDAVSIEQFEWQVQSRAYAVLNDLNGQENTGTSAASRWSCHVRVGCANFVYGNEFLASQARGSKCRMVSTPLTDRCQLSLAQAVCAYVGGAVVGPAATGKTATVHELAHSLGVAAVFFCCTERVDATRVELLLRGAAQTGCWICMESFERLTSSLLSVVSTMVQTIFTTLRTQASSADNLYSNTNRLVECTCMFPGDDQAVFLNNRTAICMTVTPLLNRSAEALLPADLSGWFKPVSLAAPELAAIARTRLAVEGFRSSGSLSRKLAALYRQCGQQLSTQPHYNFSIRAVLRVVELMCEEKLQRQAIGLTSEVGVSTANLHVLSIPDEQQICCHALAQVTGNTLVPGDDQLLFKALLAEVFPTANITGTTASSSGDVLHQEDLQTQLRSYLSCTESTLHRCPELVEKAMQLHAAAALSGFGGKCVGIALVGPAGAGKSEVRKELLAALNTGIVESGPHRELAVINPKTLYVGQLYGEKAGNGTDDDWRDGVFTQALRRANAAVAAATANTDIEDDDEDATRHTVNAPATARDVPTSFGADGSAWITLDGAIDYSWIDEVSAIFDESQQSLSLTNGERIRVRRHVRICFETDSLQGLSPTTSSRLAIVYVPGSGQFNDGSGTTAMCKAVFESWAERTGELLSTTSNIDFNHILRTSRTVVALMTRTVNKLSQAGGASINPSIHVKSFCVLVRAYFPQLECLTSDEMTAACERVVVFAATWSFGSAAASVTERGDIDSALRSLHRSVGATTVKTTEDAARSTSEFVHFAERQMPGDFSDQAMPPLNIETHFSKRKEEDALIFDFGLTPDTLEWTPWRDLAFQLTATPLSKSATPVPLTFAAGGWAEYYVPTSDTIPSMTLLELLAVPLSEAHSASTVRDGFHSGVLVTGRSEGKTALVQAFLGRQPSSRVQTRYVSLSQTTSLQTVSETVYSAVERRYQTFYGPSRGRQTLMLCIDDLHLPKDDAWGNRPVHEEVRQLVERGEVFATDRDSQHKSGKTLTVTCCTTIAVARANINSKSGSVSAATMPGLPPRLGRHFTEVALAPFRTSSMRAIFCTVLDTTLGSGGVGQTVVREGWSKHGSTCYAENLIVTPLLASLTVKLVMSASKSFVPTPTKRHYVFDFHDVVRIMQGVCHGVRHIGTTCRISPQSLLALCVHESCRVLQDKLVGQTDVDKMTELMADHVAQVSSRSDALRHESFVDMHSKWYCGHFVSRSKEIGHHSGHGRQYTYTARSSLKDFEQPVTEAMTMHPGAEYRKLYIVWTTESIKQLLRLLRNMATSTVQVVVGCPGSGRSSMVRIACDVYGAAILTLSTESTHSFLGQLAQGLVRAATKSEKIALVMHLPGNGWTECAHEKVVAPDRHAKMIDILSGLARNGDDAYHVLPDICRKAVELSIGRFRDSLTPSESIALHERVGSGGTSATMEQLQGLFMKKALDKMHFVFLVPPKHHAAILSRHPVLGSTRSMLVLYKSPQRSELIGIAKCMISSANDNPMQTLNNTDMDRVAACLADAYELLRDDAESRHSDNEWQGTQVKRSRPMLQMQLCRFKTCVATLLRIFRQKHTALFGYSGNLDVCINQLRLVADGIDQMDHEMDRLTQLVATLDIRKQELVAAMAIQKRTIAEEKTSQLMLGKYAEVERQVLAKKQASFDNMVSDLGPLLEDANESVNQIERSDWAAMKRFTVPPLPLCCTIDALLLILHREVCSTEYKDLNDKMEGEPQTWRLAFSFETRAGFRLRQSLTLHQDLCGYRKRHGCVNDETLELLQPYCNLLPGRSFDSEEAVNVYGFLGGLSHWVACQIMYEHSSRLLGPQREELDSYKTKYKETLQRYRLRQDAVVSAGLALDMLKRKHDECVQERQDAIKQLRENQEVRAVAEEMVPLMQSHKERWEDMTSFFRTQVEHMLGNCCVSACYISYLGPYSKRQRQQLRKSIEAACDSNELSMQADLDIPSFLVNKLELEKWTLVAGLSDDSFSRHNAAMVHTNGSLRACLCIDPDGQARRWLTACHASVTVHVFTDRESFLVQLKQSLEVGETLLVCRADAALEHIPTALLEHVPDDTGMILGSNIDGVHQQQLMQMANNATVLNTSESSGPSLLPAGADDGAARTAAQQQEHQHQHQQQHRRDEASIFALIRGQRLARRVRNRQKSQSEYADNASVSDSNEDEDAADMRTTWEPVEGFQLHLICEDPHVSNAPIDMLAKVGIVNFAMSTTAVERHLMHTAAEVHRPELTAEHLRWSNKVFEMAQTVYDAETALITALRNLNTKDTDSFRQLAREVSRLDNAKRDYSDYTVGPMSFTNDPNGMAKIEMYRSTATRGALFYNHMPLLAQLQPYCVLSFSLFVRCFSNCIPAPSGQELGDNLRSADAETQTKAMIQRLTAQLMTICCAGLNPESGSTFALALALNVRRRRGAVTQEMVAAFVTGGSAESDTGPPNTSGWLAQERWDNIVALSSAAASFKEQYRANGMSTERAMVEGIATDTLVDLPRLLNTDHISILWRRWCEAGCSELRPLPLDTATLNAMSSFERMCIVRCLRPDLTWIAAHLFIQDELDLMSSCAPGTGSSPDAQSALFDPLGSDVYRGASSRVALDVEQVAKILASPLTPVLYILPRADARIALEGNGNIDTGGFNDGIRERLKSAAQDQGTHLAVAWVQGDEVGKLELRGVQQQHDTERFVRDQDVMGSRGATAEDVLCAMVRKEMSSGGWVLLLAAHRSLRTMMRLETTVLAAQQSLVTQRLGGGTMDSGHSDQPAPIHSNFKLFIVTEPPEFNGTHRATSLLPCSLVAKSITIAALPPDGITAVIRAAFKSKSLGLCTPNSIQSEVESNPVWQRLLTATCYLHAVLVGRRRVLNTHNSCKSGMYGYGAIGLSSAVLLGEDDLCDALATMRSVWTSMMLASSEAALTDPNGTTWRRVRHAFVTSYSSRLQDWHDERLLCELAAHTMRPSLLDKMAAIPTAPLHTASGDKVMTRGTALHDTRISATSAPPANSADRIDEWLSSLRDAFATEPECYWLHPHVAVEFRLQTVRATLSKLKAYYTSDMPDSSLTDLHAIVPSASGGSASVLMIDNNFDSAAVRAASAGQAHAVSAPAPDVSPRNGGVVRYRNKPQPPQTPRAGNEVSSAQKLRAAVSKIRAANSIGKAVDDIKRAIVTSSDATEAVVATRQSTAKAASTTTANARRRYAMKYSDHHHGQFVRKTKVSEVARIDGYVVTPEAARTERMAKELLERTPPSLIAADVDQALRCADGVQPGESLRPLSRYVQQEAARLQVLVQAVRRDLQRARLRLTGHLASIGNNCEGTSYTEELATTKVIHALMNVEVPAAWLRIPACSCSSLAGKASRVTADINSGGGLGRWFACFLQCHEQIWRWVFEGPPVCIWMAGLTNPYGLIAAIRQDACRVLTSGSTPIEPQSGAKDSESGESYEQVVAASVSLDQVGVEWSLTAYSSPRELQQAVASGRIVHADRGCEDTAMEASGRYQRNQGYYVFGLHLEGADLDTKRFELTELPGKFSDRQRAGCFTGRELRLTSVPVMCIQAVVDTYSHAVIREHEYGSAHHNAVGASVEARATSCDPDQVSSSGNEATIAAATAAFLSGVALEDPDQLWHSVAATTAHTAIPRHGTDAQDSVQRSPRHANKYVCPIYVDCDRGGCSDGRGGLVGVVRVGSGSPGASHWALRGVAVLCSTE